jgi:hypothetical protein
VQLVERNLLTCESCGAMQLKCIPRRSAICVRHRVASSATSCRCAPRRHTRCVGLASWYISAKTYRHILHESG